MFPVKEIRKRSMVDADKANRTAARSPPSAGAPEADAAAKVLEIHGGRRPGRSGKAGRDEGRRARQAERIDRRTFPSLAICFASLHGEAMFTEYSILKVC